MFKTCKAAIGAAVLAVGLGAGAAHATAIIGSISVQDGLNNLPTTPSTGSVSNLTGIQHAGNGLSGNCTGAFVGSCGSLNAVMTDWNFGGPFPNVIVVNGFTFDLTGNGAITKTPLSCNVSGACNDALVVADLVGVVSGNGFDPTQFSGSLSFTGSCNGGLVGGVATCQSNYSGGYTYSLSAQGRTQVPEPSTLLLIGIALAGLGFMRRKNT